MDTVATVPTESQLRSAREVLDRAQAEGIEATELVLAVAANDAAGIEDLTHELRRELGDFCVHCGDEIDPPVGFATYCSRECWGAEGGDL